MTKRQAALAHEVARRRDELLAMAVDELDDKPIGFEVVIRFTLGFFEGTQMVVVRKVRPAGYEWREDSLRFYRKGHAAPSWKPL